MQGVNSVNRVGKKRVAQIVAEPGTSISWTKTSGEYET